MSDIKNEIDGFVLVPIPGNINYYVNKKGEVLSDNYRQKGCPKRLKLNPEKTGYFSVAFSYGKKVKRFSVHRLVAITFIPNPERKRTVNHINGIKTDNRVENLEWATYKENIRHAFDNGLAVALKGEDHFWSGKEALNKGQDSRKCKTCEVCGKEYKTYHYDRARFCSNTCRMEDSRLRISARNRANTTSKPVNQYDLNMNFIREWKSITEVVRNVPKTLISGIAMTCSDKYPHKTHAGFTWKYAKQ